MPYITGTITDANPGDALHTAMSAALTSAGYTLVDTYIAASRTHKLWKCAAGDNSVGKEWYLDVYYNSTGAGTIAIAPFEFYDPATDLGYRGCLAAAASSVPDGTYFSKFGASGNSPEGGNWITASGAAANYTLATSGSFGYWITVTPERVIMLLNTDPTRLMYAGFYQPDPLYAAKAGAALYPLICARLDPGGTSATSATPASITAGMTRVPPQNASISWGTILSVTCSAAPGTPALPVGSTLMYPFSAVAAGDCYTTTLLARWGTLRDVVVLNASAAVVRGDTITIGGAQYVLGTMGSNMVLAMKAA